MNYKYQHSYAEKVHCYEFIDIPLKLTLTPAHYLFTGINQNLNLHCIDLVRSGNKIFLNAGKSICDILNKFIHANKNIALCYYPSFVDGRDAARFKLFNNWCKRYITSDELITYTNSLYFPVECQKNEELTIQFFIHEDFPNQNDLVKYIKEFTASFSNK